MLDEQIIEANDGDPVDFSLWRQKTEVVLRNVVGDASPLYEAFQGVRYSLAMFSSDTPDSAFDNARRSGVRSAVAIASG